MKKVFGPVTNSSKDVSEYVTRTMTEISKENNKALENLNNKLLEIMNDRGLLASYLLFPSSKVTNPEHNSLFTLVEDPSANGVNDLLINKTKSVTLNDNLLTFRDTDKKFDLQGDLLKLITNKNHNVDLATLRDKKLALDFAKEMYFDERALGNKSTRDKSLIRLLYPPAIMASRISTIFSPENPSEPCDRLKLLLQEKQAGNDSDIINEEIVGIADEFLEIRSMSSTQHKLLVGKCLNQIKTIK